MKTLDLFDRPVARLLGARPRRHAIKRRDLGIERAGEHADLEAKDWRKRAAEIIRQFAAEIRAPFLTEDVLPYARAAGLPDPPDARAWGAAAQTARRLGYITAVGTRKAKTSNMSPKVLWQGVNRG